MGGPVLSSGWSELREFPKEGQGGGHRGATWVVKARVWVPTQSQEDQETIS